MNQHFTSIIPEDIPIPEPPHLQYIGLIVSCFMSFFFFIFILFVVFESSLDMLGFPFQFATKQETVYKEEDFSEDGIHSEPEILSPQEIVSRFHLLSPFPETSVFEEDVIILCTWRMPRGRFQTLPFVATDLKVDNLPLSWDEYFGDNTWFIHLTLTPGPHQISLPFLETTIFVENSEHSAPPPQNRFTMHKTINDPSQCGSCHELYDLSNVIVRKGHNLAIGNWKGNDSCLKCHSNEQFQKSHRIDLQKTNCNDCHAVHGTVNSRKLLKN
jgi:hypothetical protein